MKLNRRERKRREEVEFTSRSVRWIEENIECERKVEKNTGLKEREGEEKIDYKKEGYLNDRKMKFEYRGKTNEQRK